MLGHMKNEVEALLHIALVGQKCYEIRRKYCLSSQLFKLVKFLLGFLHSINDPSPFGTLTFGTEYREGIYLHECS
jgi:hypothetical protein